MPGALSLLLALAAAPQRSAPARPAPAGAPAKAFPFPTETHTLPNGLRLVLIPYDSPGLVAYYTLMRVGSRNEPEAGRSGFAHFFEHLMFRGTPNTPPEKFREVMSRAGSRDNAATGNDTTHYFATFSKQYLDQVIGLYADMFQHLS